MSKLSIKNSKRFIIFIGIVLMVIASIYITIVINDIISINKLKPEIKNYIYSIEPSMTYAIQNNSGTYLDSNKKIDFAVAYILKNKELYKDKIYKEKIRNCIVLNGSNYYLYEYVNKEFIQEIVNQHFNDTIIDISKYDFYVKQLDKVGLFSFTKESLVKKSYEIEEIKKVKDSQYKVTLKYTYTDNQTNSKISSYVKYLLKYDNTNSENKFKVIEALNSNK